MNKDIFWLTNQLKEKQTEERLRKKTEQSEAERVYMESFVCIQKISWTEWYHAIKKFWQNKFSEALVELSKYNAISNPWEVTKAQEKLDLSSGFLYYLSKYEWGI